MLCHASIFLLRAFLQAGRPAHTCAPRWASKHCLLPRGTWSPGLGTAVGLQLSYA